MSPELKVERLCEESIDMRESDQEEPRRLESPRDGLWSQR